jgi:hypothetical protein
MHLLWRKVHRDAMQASQNLIYKRLVLARLLHNEMATAFLCDFDESIASHVLYTYKATSL